MTIDVSTPEARQAILDAMHQTGTLSWLVGHRPNTIEAAFTRIDELEAWYKAMKETCDDALDRSQSRMGRINELEALARDLATSLDSLNNGTNHWCDPLVPTCGKCVAEGALDRARAAGVLQ